MKNEAASEAIATYGLLAEQACSSVNVPCINLFKRLQEEDFVSLLTDAVHPGPAGNALIASLLLEQSAMKTFLTVED